MHEMDPSYVNGEELKWAREELQVRLERQEIMWCKDRKLYGLKKVIVIQSTFT